ATSRTVHRARPAGGGPQTIAMTAACCVLSSSFSGGGRGSSPSAASKPPARYAWRPGTGLSSLEEGRGRRCNEERDRHRDEPDRGGEHAAALAADEGRRFVNEEHS